MTFTIGSLFSGIGGLELGLEWAGLGPVLWQVERDEKARAVLAHHWPEVTRFDDVCTVGGTNLTPVDLICGGFPCQDVSSAGKRAGLTGARSGLWYEFARIVDECRPRWIVVENVASGAKAWVDAVRGDLERLGYASLPVPISASDVGAPHRRARVFLVAHAHGDREPSLAVDAEVAGASALAANTDGASVRQQQGRSGGASGGDAALVAVDGQDAPDAMRPGLQGASASEEDSRRARPAGGGWGPPVPDMVRVVHGLPRRLDGARARIGMLGNSVVPQCAEVVGCVIRELLARSARASEVA